MILSAVSLAVAYSPPTTAPAPAPSQSQSSPLDWSLPYPTYEFLSSYSNNVVYSQNANSPLKGVTGGIINNTIMQKYFLSSSSGVFLGQNGGRANWCNVVGGSANTTSFTISTASRGGIGGGAIYTPSAMSLLASYKAPFAVEIPNDAYQNSCTVWNYEITQFKADLNTYWKNGTQVKQFNNANINEKTMINFGAMDASVVYYRAMVNICNNFISLGYPQMCKTFWNGLENTFEAADLGDWAKGANIDVGQWNNATVIEFAQSHICVDNAGNTTTDSFTGLSYGSCAEITKMANAQAHTTNGAVCCKTSILSGVVLALHGTGLASNAPVTMRGNGASNTQWTAFTNAEYFLAQLYAVYNFTQHEGISHGFFVTGAYPMYFPSTTYYPAPYNTTYIKGLPLTSFLSESGGSAFQGSNKLDSPIIGTGQPCSSSAQASHSINPYGLSPGRYLTQANNTGGGTTTSTNWNKFTRNSMYYMAICMGYGLPDFGNTLYWQSANTATKWFFAYGSMLNRMLNVQTNGNYSAVAISGASSASTNVKALGGKGTPLLLWADTNSSSSDRFSVSLTLANYHLGSNVILWNAENNTVKTCLSCTTFSFAIDVGPAPSHTWAPIYVANYTQSNFANVYNTCSQNSASGGIYKYQTPKAFSCWGLFYSSAAPAAVTDNATGTPGVLTQAGSLSAFNSSLIGYTLGGNTNNTQGSWFYDSTNHIVYTHWMGTNNVELVISTSFPTYTVTFSMTPTGIATTTPSGAVQLSGTVPISAAPIQGYTFTSWVVSAGITVANPNSQSTTITVGASGTVQATFTPNLTCGVH